jgi:UDP-glucose 4-epimerase
MRVAVTGGSGFIGSHVVDHLRSAGHEVIVIDHRVKPHRDDVLFEDVDILDLAAVQRATQGCEIVYHLAAVSNVNYALKYPVYTVDLNITGTVNVLEAARQNGARRVLFASTVWVYTGSRGEGPLTEDSPFHIPDAGHIYTTSKIAGEMIFHNYASLYKQPFTILRYGIPYGPRMREELVIPIFVRKAFAGQPLTIQGDGRQYRNYIYIDDLAAAHMLALRPEAENQVYNLEGPWPVSVKEVAETIRKILGGTVKIESIPARPGDYGGRTVSADKAEKELGWTAKVPFEEGMRRYIAWYREQGAGRQKQGGG